MHSNRRPVDNEGGLSVSVAWTLLQLVSGLISGQFLVQTKWADVFQQDGLD